jgi:hypothetical protein
MLSVRSRMMTRSTGTTGEPPHGPLHADDWTPRVEPCVGVPGLITLSAGANKNGLIALPLSVTTLHLSPAAGLHGALRVGPAPVKSVATGV